MMNRINWIGGPIFSWRVGRQMRPTCDISDSLLVHLLTKTRCIVPYVMAQQNLVTSELTCLIYTKWKGNFFKKITHMYFNGKPAWKFGGIIVFPVGICRTILSPSNSQRSHLDWLISRAHGRSSISSVFTHGFHTDSFTRMGLSHWVSCSLLFQGTYQRGDKRKWLIHW